MMLTGDGGELDARRVAWSGGRAPALEPRDRAVVDRKRALAAPVGRSAVRPGRGQRGQRNR